MRDARWGTGGWVLLLAVLLRAQNAWAYAPFAPQTEWVGPSTSSQFGYAVAVQGDTAVVGVRNAGGIGEAVVFVRGGTTWTQQAQLAPADGATGDAFGASVSLSPNTIVVGAPGKAGQTGAAYVFVRAGAAWTEQAEVTAADAGPGSQLGSAVVVSGDTLFMGAPGKSAVYAFARSGSLWSQQQEIVPADVPASDSFGASITYGGTRLLVGAPAKASGAGAVYVFTSSGASWSQQQMLIASDGASGDAFGSSLAVSGNVAWMGAPGHASSAGAVYVFASSGGVWSQLQEVTAFAGASGDRFGASVALGPGTAVVGAPFASLSRGAAYVFANGTSWTQQQPISASDGAANDLFGWSVALDANTAVVGAYGKNSAAGAAYVYVAPVAPVVSAVPALGPWAPALAGLLLFAGLRLTRNRRRTSA
jgi:hypothetical protein